MRRALFATVCLTTLAAGPARAAEECPDLAAKLDACATYTCTFTHPFTRQPMEKRVEGVKDAACVYVEQMPNNGLMTCQYTESMRKAVAAYYRDLEQATRTSTSLRTGPDGKTETRYTIDGKDVKNPLQEAMKNGQCVVTGYGKKSGEPDGPRE